MKNLLALLLLLPVLTSADPGPATRYLMNEPASLMDVGLMGIHQHLLTYKKRIEGELSDITGDPNELVVFWEEYDFKNDLIVIRANALGSTRNAEQSCRGMLNSLGRITDLGLSLSFLHRNYSRDGQPEDLFEEVRKRVQLQCEVRDINSKSVAVDEPIVKGHRMLASDDVYILKLGGDDEN